MMARIKAATPRKKTPKILPVFSMLGYKNADIKDASEAKKRTTVANPINCIKPPLGIPKTLKSLAR